MAFNLHTTLLFICVLGLSQNTFGVYSNNLRKRSTNENSLREVNIPTCGVMVQKVFSQIQELNDERGRLLIPYPNLRFPDNFIMNNVDCGSGKYCWFSEYDLYLCKNIENPHYGRLKKVLIYDSNREELLFRLSKDIEGCNCRYYGTMDESLMF